MDENELEDTLPVYFEPPLWAQRIGWVLEQIRRYSIRTILDLGCGEGQLLRCLTLPAPYLYDTALPLDVDVSARQIYPSLLAGIDICERDLERAILVTEPEEMDESSPRYATVPPRWNPLAVELWSGPLETINEQFIDRFECIVSTEVVEHLPQEILDKFFPIALGYYRPQFLLLTTPNYDFNELFTRPGKAASTGYPDPTGATNRIFRHHDHKREWTIPEWRQWCEEAALEYGYEVEMGDMGLPQEKDPYGRSPSVAGKATQTAAFKRRDNRDRVRPTFSGRDASPLPEPPRLRVLHVHPVHRQAGNPLNFREIQEQVKASLARSPTKELPVEHIWKEDVDLACGGSLRTLVDALIQRPLDGSEPEWQITEASADMGKWLILWKNWTPVEYEEGHGLWHSLGVAEREEIESNIDHVWSEVSEDWWSEDQPMQAEEQSYQHWDLETEGEINRDSAGWPTDPSVDPSMS